MDSKKTLQTSEYKDQTKEEHFDINLEFQKLHARIDIISEGIELRNDLIFVSLKLMFIGTVIFFLLFLFSGLSVSKKINDYKATLERVKEKWEEKKN